MNRSLQCFEDGILFNEEVARSHDGSVEVAHIRKAYELEGELVLRLGKIVVYPHNRTMFEYLLNRWVACSSTLRNMALFLWCTPIALGLKVPVWIRIKRKPSGSYWR